MNRFDQLLEKKKSEHKFVYEALQFLVNTLPNYDKDQLYISFNGGKDATIVLFLTYIAMSRITKLPIFDLQPKMYSCVYFTEKNPFQEVDDFMSEMKGLLNLNIIEIERDFKQSMKVLIEEHNLKAVIMGSRRTDPYCDKLEKITASDLDKGYPQFIRINPIINWTYEQVWKFLLDFQIPYCKLYEKGYTYLGNKDNTSQNPYLSQSNNKYKSASQIDGQFETVSRKEQKKNQQELANSFGIFISQLDNKEIPIIMNKNNIHHSLIITPEKMSNFNQFNAELNKVDFNHFQKIIVVSDVSESSDQIRNAMTYHNITKYDHKHFTEKVHKPKL